MDQFPLGKGKRVRLIPTAAASIVFSLFTNTECGLKTYPSRCFSTSNHFDLLYSIPSALCELCSISKTNCGIGHGTSSDHAHSHSHLHAFHIPFYSFSLTSLVARIYSQSNYHFHIAAFNTPYIYFPASYLII